VPYGGNFEEALLLPFGERPTERIPTSQYFNQEWLDGIMKRWED
jgi:hypothetical protein